MFQRGRSCHLLLLVLVFLSSLSFTLASAPTSFCKCTCFTNSTIIPLDSADSPSISPENLFHLRSRSTVDDDDTITPNEKRADEHRTLTCNDCNRKFCLDYNLPICQGAKEEDVFTTCFQRDSRKDEAIVYIFIVATSGLLAWAAFKPWVEKWLEAARERRSYFPVSESAGR